MSWPRRAWSWFWHSDELTGEALFRITVKPWLAKVLRAAGARRPKEKS